MSGQFFEVEKYSKELTQKYCIEFFFVKKIIIIFLSAFFTLLILLCIVMYYLKNSTYLDLAQYATQEIMSFDNFCVENKFLLFCL